MYDEYVALQLSDALILADDHFPIFGKEGPDGKPIRYKLSECYKDMTAYAQLKDSVVDVIELSDNPALEPAKKLLKRIHNRDLVSHITSPLRHLICS